MAENGAFESDPLTGGSFSQLLFADEVVGFVETEQCYNYTSSFSGENPSKMLCFGDYKTDCELGFPATLIKPKRSGPTCSDSSDNINGTKSLSKSNKKRNGSESKAKSAGDGSPAVSHGTLKKTKSENSPATGRSKGKREKLGERITALQQIVSPFGKTDTASVLHEAMGYIKFLQEQVHVLCSPYLHLLHEDGGGDVEKIEELRSRGLCLVPIDGIVDDVATSNGADFWSPAMKSDKNDDVSSKK